MSIVFSLKINLELGVAQEEGVLDYYVFNEPALNTFSVKLVEKLKLQKNNYYIKK